MSSRDRTLPCPQCRTGHEDEHDQGCENHPGFDLFPDDVVFPKLYANENKPGRDAVIVVKLFVPMSNARWYITEYDREQDIAFGLCDLGQPELGYVSGQELRDLRVGPRGVLRVERDLSFGPGNTVGDVRSGVVS
jgi:hypothetical protein